MTFMLGLIVGSGLNALKIPEDSTFYQNQTTPYGALTSKLSKRRLASIEVLVLARHGETHSVAPHEINYRANIWALKNAGARVVISIATVGGITEDFEPGAITIPDQILDYTYNRSHTFFQDDAPVTHIDFTYPYCADLRQLLIRSAAANNVSVIDYGTYAATQGPRLETAAEINKLARDGADIVGMTGMPEAALAREAGLCYAAVAVVVNRAAGRGEGVITAAEIDTAHSKGVSKILAILENAVAEAATLRFQLPAAIVPA